jgi:hypothetical protein
MKNSILIISMWAIFFWMVCSRCTIQPTPEPVDPSDYPMLDASEACARLCENLEKHDCQGKMGSPGPDERFGTGDDVSCHETCVMSVSSVPWMLDKARCGAVADRCEEIDNCR